VSWLQAGGERLLVGQQLLLFGRDAGQQRLEGLGESRYAVGLQFVGDGLLEFVPVVSYCPENNLLWPVSDRATGVFMPRGAARGMSNCSGIPAAQPAIRFCCWRFRCSASGCGAL